MLLLKHKSILLEIFKNLLDCHKKQGGPDPPPISFTHEGEKWAVLDEFQGKEEEGRRKMSKREGGAKKINVRKSKYSLIFPTVRNINSNK